MSKLVLIRHGQSEWNLSNQFTGWVDVNLSEKGVEEAKKAGRLIKEHGLEFDQAYTSLLTRAIKTTHWKKVTNFGFQKLRLGDLTNVTTVLFKA